MLVILLYIMPEADAYTLPDGISDHQNVQGQPVKLLQADTVHL